jgi:TetR/AcrR family transcriptional regulator
LSALRQRLPAALRRAAVLDAACRVFADGSYRGTTTAEIAREAGVSEPILYRHFASKRDLYLACLADAWQRVRSGWEEAIAGEPDPGLWLTVMGRSFLALREDKILIANLWVQALTEASEDPEIRRYLGRHMREVHDFVGDVLVRAQDAGAIPKDRDVGAEAWIFVAVGLLGAVGRRLGGLLEDDLGRIRESRRRWLTGEG